MKTSEILELIRAGYSKAEIEAMDGDAEKIEHPAKQTEVSKEPEAKPEPEKEEQMEMELEKPEPKQEKSNYESETEKLVKALGLKFDALTSAIQASNVNSIEHGGDSAMTADDVIRSIVQQNYGGDK